MRARLFFLLLLAAASTKGQIRVGMDVSRWALFTLAPEVGYRTDEYLIGVSTQFMFMDQEGSSMSIQALNGFTAGVFGVYYLRPSVFVRGELSYGTTDLKYLREGWYSSPGQGITYIRYGEHPHQVYYDRLGAGLHVGTEWFKGHFRFGLSTGVLIRANPNGNFSSITFPDAFYATYFRHFYGTGISPTFGFHLYYYFRVPE